MQSEPFLSSKISLLKLILYKILSINVGVGGGYTVDLILPDSESSNSIELLSKLTIIVSGLPASNYFQFEKPLVTCSMIGFEIKNELAR